MTYTLLNVVFLLAAAAFAVFVLLTGRTSRPVPTGPEPRTGTARNPRRAWVLAHAPLVAGVATLVILLALTAVFDSVIVGVGLVAYDPGRILGWFVGLAPVEDLAYTVGAVLVLPAVWSLLGRRRRRGPAATFANSTDAAGDAPAEGTVER